MLSLSQNEDRELKKSFKERLAEIVDIPIDIASDIPAVSVIGNKELRVEGYKGIIEYCEHTIRLNTAQFMIKIDGKALEIKAITTEFIHIKGLICKIELIN